MSKKKYKPVKEAVDFQDAAYQAIVALDLAGVWAQDNKDAAAMAAVGNGWAKLAQTVFNIEQVSKLSDADEPEIAELHSDTEIVNRVGFSPHWEE